jgi:hypothetical protein
MGPLLNEREASLLQAFRRLPPDAAVELTALAERLGALHPNTKIDWSDAWSDEDLKEFTAASVRRLEAEESDDVVEGYRASSHFDTYISPFSKTLIVSRRSQC